MQSERRRARAFTLIELLVVVAIIALLLSILLPSLGRAREQAKEAKCAAGLRSFGLGFHTYAGEQRDYLCSGSFDPEVSNGRDGPVDRVGWVADLVNGMLAFPATQLCPSNPARYNQKLGAQAAGSNSYTPEQARDLIARGYNTNYTQAWYMARTEWNPAQNDYNVKRVRATLGPLRIGRLVRAGDARVPLLGDGRTDLDDRVLGERAVKTMTDGPWDGPFGVQNWRDFGPAHGFGSWMFGKKDHNRARANVVFADAHVRVFVDRDRDGEFGLDTSGDLPRQKDLDEGAVFDGVLSIGRRSADAWSLQ